MYSSPLKYIFSIIMLNVVSRTKSLAEVVIYLCTVEDLLITSCTDFMTLFLINLKTVSMNLFWIWLCCRENLQLLRQRYYYATWKADGTRYMMLITMDGCYLIDRSFNFRRVQMRFPCRSTNDVRVLLYIWNLWCV